MIESVSEAIEAMARPAHPNCEETARLLAGWETYFVRYAIAPERQQSEFDGIMKARVMSGIISLLAPGDSDAR